MNKHQAHTALPVNPEVLSQIEAFIAAPIGLQKDLQFKYLEQTVELHSSASDSDQFNKTINYTRSTAWKMIWTHRKDWVVDYLRDLEKIIKETSNKAPVSYTHLDVYKRQDNRLWHRQRLPGLLCRRHRLHWSS